HITDNSLPYPTAITSTNIRIGNDEKYLVTVKKDAAPAVDFSQIEPVENDATEYLKSILVGMGFTDVGVTAREAAEDVYFEITCSEDYGNIIGRRGETLDALQYLTRLFVNRANDNNKRVALNVGDYRARREETLRALAKRQAQRVLKYGRSSSLEPMNPYERRIIHTAIQEIEGVTSHSVGEGDRRRVVVTPEGGEKRGNYRNDRRGGRDRKAPYVPQVSAEPREQKVDAVSSSRYGKIEPRKTVETTEE
ncbi:MAG: RNA-binding cell elongation regulator Jag/EloR, partial [Acutalibacteraceae bacterium]|nr:RNA-binding cell elongation regulator Jag/EloR [Acutalibacteraceae bacterium]